MPSFYSFISRNCNLKIRKNRSFAFSDFIDLLKCRFSDLCFCASPDSLSGGHRPRHSTDGQAALRERLGAEPRWRLLGERDDGSVGHRHENRRLQSGESSSFVSSGIFLCFSFTWPTRPFNTPIQWWHFSTFWNLTRLFPSILYFQNEYFITL